MTTHNDGTIRVGRMTIHFLLEGSGSQGSLAMFEFEVSAGAKVPVAHSHDAYDETIYGLEGIMTFTVAGQVTEIGPGEVLFIPRGAVHHFDNKESTNAKALAIVTPGILGPDYFREVATVVDRSAGGPPDLAAIGAVMKRHGLTPVP